MEKERVLITGATGQDGSYLCDMHLKRGNYIVAIARSNAQRSLGCIQHLKNSDIIIESGDISDKAFLSYIYDKHEHFDKVFHMAAQSFVASSWQLPYLTYMTNIMGTLNVLDVVKNVDRDSKVYIAGSSEMLGQLISYDHLHPNSFYPKSPYGISKLAGYWTGLNYRESYDMFVTNGILYNHSSERRGTQFVMRKISSCIAAASNRVNNNLPITTTKFGYLLSYRDVGYAPEYVEAMDIALSYKEPLDFVLGTGETFMIQDIINHGLTYCGLEYAWEYNNNIPTQCNITNSKMPKCDSIIIICDRNLFRPAEVVKLIGSHDKMSKLFNWSPKMHALDVVERMIDHDRKILFRS